MPVNLNDPRAARLFTLVADAAKDGAVREILLYPTLISDFRARRADPAEARRIAGKMRWLCDQLGTPSAWDSAENCLVVRVSEVAERAA